MATLTSADAIKSISMTISGAVSIEDPIFSNFASALDDFNTKMPISSVSYSALSYTLTLKDARTLTVVLRLGPPVTLQNVSADFWTEQEYSVKELLRNTIVALVVDSGMSALTVTYA